MASQKLIYPTASIGLGPGNCMPATRNPRPRLSGAAFREGCLRSQNWLGESSLARSMDDGVGCCWVVEDGGSEYRSVRPTLCPGLRRVFSGWAGMRRYVALRLA